MGKQIFPDEIINNSAEANFHTHSVNTKIIYTATVLFIIAGLAALPFIYVDVSVRSQGVLKPLTERNQLTSLVSGKIEKLYIRENQSVKEGEKIVEIEAPLLREKLRFNIKRQQKINLYLQDLNTLRHIDSVSVLQPVELATNKYRHSFLQFRQQVRSSKQEIGIAERKYQRDRQLYEQEMLSEAEYEQTAFDLQYVQNEFDLLFEQQLHEWQSEQILYQDEQEQLETEIEQLNEERRQYIIRAPISGTIQNMRGIYKGSFVTPNQTLAEISPDTELIAECYVPPGDIGLLKEGMETRLQISAFDYNQWGIITGKINEISNDISVIDNQPVFIVRSLLDQKYFELENGYQGMLKKGMTLQARFTITRRNLFQLIYDDVDDWLNPNWNNQSSIQQATM